MIIVVIHWKIKPDKEKEFKDWWTGKAHISNRTGLVGEFLSAPLSKYQLPKSDSTDYGLFEVADYRFGTSYQYISFFNVGIWESWGDFYTEVGHNFNDANQIMDWEYERRTRTILEPAHWRRGLFELPSEDRL